MVNWFSSKDIKIKPVIYLNNLHGYVLPHAGTQYTGKILSHTLRFRPYKNFTNILIIYLPAKKQPNMGKYYHEYGVIYNTLQSIPEFNHKNFIGYNMLKPYKLPHKINKNNTLYVVSADFSHFLPLKDAIHLENCAAHSLMQRNFKTQCSTVIDDSRSFKFLYKIIPRNWILQWIGRTRSPGKEGVGYLSFLIRSPPHLKRRRPDGFFVTAYDENMRTRECLGNTKKWSKNLEKDLLEDVLYKAGTTSRLTGGQFLNIPITNYTITYLYKDRAKKFLRGWHAILKDALYLPDVFLENTYNNGKWIKDTDQEWPIVTPRTKFKLRYTFKKLENKAKKYNNRRTRKYKTKPTLFSSQVYHSKV